MTFSNFLQVLAFNFLTQTLPFCVVVYFSIRVAITHGAFSSKRKSNSNELKNE